MEVKLFIKNYKGEWIKMIKTKENIWSRIKRDIENLNLDENQKNQLLKNLLNLKEKNINILITGATGSGKSSTINAIFNTEIAEVGYGVDPHTMDIEKFELDNLTLWDSPGLGDGKEADIRHSKNIINKLNEKDNKGNALIDIVLVIIDGSSRDMGTSYQLINEVIIPNIQNKERVLVAINQCDVAMKGRNWDQKNKTPKKELVEFLNSKVNSVHKRIKQSTGVDIKPIYYSAYEYYNISKLLSFIIEYTPKDKRPVYINNVNTDPNPWKHNDDIKDYNEEIKQNLMESVVEGIENGAEVGGRIGKAIAGSFGETAGKFLGGAVGAIKGFLGGIFG